ncbi:MAG: glycosyl hydrolase family 18, partial [Lachnospiraceae bacterium]|nr:glycosyl hydrolase family 18 [Lachnospiraceae bacterium]
SKIMTGDGVIGCVKNSALSGKESVVTPSTLPERVYNHMAMEKSVVMGWHQVTNPVANQYIGDLISSAKGLNVISPTWYYLNDNQGAIADFSSAEYVQTAHNNGIEVWALISNFENREVNTTAVLNTTSYRDRVVESLITSVIASGADGINVDFEGLEYECKDGFAAFIKELSIRCEQNGLYLSVDDYPPSEYTSFYGRQMQADYADYVILMGYDEYNGASPVAGPTASLPFVVKGIENTLREVPAERLILGMPFYTRVWSNTYGTVTSESMGMATVEEMIAQRGAAKNWLENDGLNYTEYMNEDTLIQIWVEDSESLAKKLALIGNYSLGGGAFWKLGLEPASIWDTVAMYFP